MDQQSNADGEFHQVRKFQKSFNDFADGLFAPTYPAQAAYAQQLAA